MRPVKFTAYSLHHLVEVSGSPAVGSGFHLHAADTALVPHNTRGAHTSPATGFSLALL